MKFLGPDHEIKVRYIIQKGGPAALGHASKKSVNDRPVPGKRPEHPHFAECLLLGKIAYATGVQQDDIRFFLFDRDRMPTVREHLSDLFRVALVHLATVRLM